MSNAAERTRLANAKLMGQDTADDAAEKLNNLEVSEKKKWLEETFKQKDSNDSDDIASGSANPGSDLVKDRQKWLAEQAKKKDDEEHTYSGAHQAPGGALASDRKAWLENAFKKKEAEDDEVSGSDAPGSALVKDRMNAIWGKKDEPAKNESTASGTENPGSNLVKDRAKWLAEQSKKKEDAEGSEASGSPILGLSWHLIARNGWRMHLRRSKKRKRRPTTPEVKDRDPTWSRIG